MQPNQALLQSHEPEATDHNARARVGRLNNKSITETNLWPLKDQLKIRETQGTPLYTEQQHGLKRTCKKDHTGKCSKKDIRGHAGKRTITPRETRRSNIHWSSTSGHTTTVRTMLNKIRERSVAGLPDTSAPLILLSQVVSVSSCPRRFVMVKASVLPFFKR
jgi:hypothetical protein